MTEVPAAHDAQDWKRYGVKVIRRDQLDTKDSPRHPAILHCTQALLALPCFHGGRLRWAMCLLSRRA